jgi:hypothetical protein
MRNEAKDNELRESERKFGVICAEEEAKSAETGKQWSFRPKRTQTSPWLQQ